MDPISRRSFLKQGVLFSAGFYFSGCASLPIGSRRPATELEELPDFSEEAILRHVVGLRPYREKTFRLEPVEAGDRFVVHNYGHGGAGFTMSWGCSEIAAEMAASRARPGEPVAVLGAGVLGLTTARVLQEKGFRVRVYARDFLEQTTSSLAGAQWSPTSVAFGESAESIALFQDVLARAFRRFQRLEGPRYGISRRRNYVAEGYYGGPIERLPSGLISEPELMERMPFPGVPRPGRMYITFLIEPPVFLRALMADLPANDVEFVTRTFANQEEVSRLNERVVVNCLGLGAGPVFQDPQVVPIRGQLVHLKPRPNLDYLLVHRGYMFPRSDVVLLGGTFDKGETSTVPDPETARRILRINRDFFWAGAGMELAAQSRRETTSRTS